jgi:hypothetical protein
VEDEGAMPGVPSSTPPGASAVLRDSEDKARNALSGMRRGKARPLSPLKDAEKPLGRRGAKPEAGAFAKFARCRVDELPSSAPPISPPEDAAAGQVRVTLKSPRAPTPGAGLPPRPAGVQKPGMAGKGVRRVVRGAKSLAQVAHDLPPEVALLLSHLERFRSVRAFSRAQSHANLRKRHMERLSMVLGLTPLPPRLVQPPPPPLPVYSPPLEPAPSDSHYSMFETLEQARQDGSWLASRVEPAASAAWSGMRPAPSSMPMPVPVRPSISQPHPTMGRALAFQPCPQFSGRRPGFVFKTGAMGLGYYWDAFGLTATDVHGAPRAAGCF